jgi:hypothetical protein
MQTVGWTRKSSVRTGISYFQSSPFHAHYFLSTGLFLLIDLLFIAVIVGRYWTQLPALAVFLLGGVALALLSFWYRLFRMHTAMQELISSGSFAVPDPGSTSDRAYSTIAALSFQGLFTSSGAVMLCLMALVEVLHSR